MFDTDALWLTLKLASATTALLILLALPLSYLIVFPRTRLRVVLEAAIALPLVLPPTLLVLSLPSSPSLVCRLCSAHRSVHRSLRLLSRRKSLRTCSLQRRASRRPSVEVV